MNERKQRIGENEAIFRSVNEEVSKLNVTFTAATNTMRIVWPAHGVNAIEADAHAARSVFAAPVSARTSVRVPSPSSTNTWNESADDEFEAWAR